MRVSRICLVLGLVGMSGLLLADRFEHHSKIAVEGGSPLPGIPQIMVDNTVLDPALRCIVRDVFGNGTVTYFVPYSDPRLPSECQVIIRLRGYQDTHATLREGSVIVLKRLGDHEGSSVTATGLRAPEKAQKAYAKGLSAEQSRNWANAQKEFEKAIAIYPDYAQAWSDLGDVFAQQSKGDEARAAFDHAMKADPKYIRPYVQTARLDITEGKVDHAIQVTDKAIKLNPTEFPPLYFYNAVANFDLKRFSEAEASAKRTIELDANHEIPRAEDLLGLILASEGDRAGALEHWKRYLEMSPHAKDAEEVKRRIDSVSGMAQVH